MAAASSAPVSAADVAAADSVLPLEGLFGIKRPESVSVPVEHLDYDYVEKCEDASYLAAILQTLKSGKEGRYPHLEDTVEEKMLGLLPENERRRYLALKSEPTVTEKVEATDDIAEWLSNAKKGDEQLLEARSRSTVDAEVESDIFGSAATTSGGGGGAGNKRAAGLPPVRGSGARTYTSAGAEPAPAPAAASSARYETEERKTIGSGTGGARPEGWQDPRKGSFKAYYDKWDAFDVDEELDRIEAEERGKKQAIQDAEEARKAREEERIARRRAELGALKLRVEPRDMSETERTYHARREKEKGNEYFRSNEMQDSILYYGRSLAFDPGSAVVYANRALAYSRLKRFAKAEEDCTSAIERDATYVKAWVRRGSVRHSRGNYVDAIADFDRALKLDPANKSAQKQRKESYAKLREVEGVHADTVLSSGDRSAVAPGSRGTRLAIEEDSSTDDDSDTDTEEVPIGRAARAAAASNTAASAGTAQTRTSTRLTIEESDSDSDSSEEEKKESEDVAPSASAPAAAAAEEAAPKRRTRLAIAESDSDSSSDSESEAAAAEVEGAAALAAEPAEAVLDVKRIMSDAAASRQSGNDLFRAKKFSDAIAAYDDVQRLCADYKRAPQLVATLLPALSNRAFARLKLGDHAAAAADCNAALEVWGGDGSLVPDEDREALSSVVVKVLFRRGLALKALGRGEEAIRDFEAVLEAEPGNQRPADEIKAIRQAAAAGAPPVPAPSASKPPAASSGGGAGAAPADAGGAGSPAALGVEAAARKKAEALAESARSLVWDRAEVPPQPRTTYEFEKECASLRRNPALLAAYLRSIDVKALVKVFRRPLEADTVAAVAAGLEYELSGAENDGPDLSSCVIMLKGLAKAPSFKMTTMMLTSSDTERLRGVLASLKAAGKPKAAADLTKKFGL